MRVITVNEDTGERVYCCSDVAKICNVSIQTIKLWESKGYIPKSVRAENNYRYWTEDALTTLVKYANTSVKDRR